MSRPTSLLSAMRKDMTGLEFVQAMIDGTLPHNSMADTLGYRIVEAEKGRVVITARPNDTLLNPHGTVHGGLAAKELPSISSKPSSLARARPTNSGAVHMRGASVGC